MKKVTEKRREHWLPDTFVAAKHYRTLMKLRVVTTYYSGNQDVKETRECTIRPQEMSRTAVNPKGGTVIA
ncbi:MAG: hypothetical protein WCJ93_00020 [Methanomicrobiales archaeon]